MTFIPIVIGALNTVSEWLFETGALGNKWTSGDHPNYNIIENGQNTEKSPGDLRRLVITQTSEKDYQLILMCKNSPVNNLKNNNDLSHNKRMQQISTERV